jgi:carbonic anhydrase
MVKDTTHINKRAKISRQISYLLVLFILLLSCSPRQQDEQIDNLAYNDGLTRLMEGNTRFSTNHPIHPDQTLEKLRELEKGQHPFAVVISCSDSRVPPELIFDQGFGDLFVIRNAGNIIADYEIGSVEYAVEHLHTKLVIVLGHSNCGAIGAYLEHQHDSIPNHIQSIVNYIKNETEELSLDKNSHNLYEESIIANVLHGVYLLQESEPVLKEFIKKRELKIVGAVYDLHSGKVNIISE